MEMISVIMCIYNESEKLILESVKSILSQTYKKIELIVIADNPNNLPAIDCVRGIAREDERVYIYINERNMGLPRSLNRALSYVRGKYVARMDADDISLPNRLEKELEVLKELDLDLVASGIIRISMDGEIIRKDTICFSSKNVSSILKYTDVLPHPTWLVRKELYDKLGGYRDFFSCEDYDFLLRAKKINARMGMAPYLLLKYRSNDKGISQNNTLRQALATHYLSKNHARIDSITSEELAEYVCKNMTQQNIEKYSLHSEKLTRIAKQSEIKVGDIWGVLKSILSCKYIFYNYKQIIVKRLYSIREKQKMRC